MNAKKIPLYHLRRPWAKVNTMIAKTRQMTPDTKATLRIASLRLDLAQGLAQSCAALAKWGKDHGMHRFARPRFVLVRSRKICASGSLHTSPLARL